jgi:hypothetical protein
MFQTLINNINETVINNEYDILTWFFYNEKYNLFFPVEQTSLIRINNIIPYDIYNSLNNFDDFLHKKIQLYVEQRVKYPLIGNNWNGEMEQKVRHTLYNNNISETFNFGLYSTLLRNIKI